MKAFMNRRLVAGLLALGLAAGGLVASNQDQPQTTPEHCKTGYPGGYSWYCALGDPATHVNTAMRFDGLVDIQVCDLANREGQAFELSFVWTALGHYDVTQPMTTTPTTWQPQSSQPCLRLIMEPLMPEGASPSPMGDWSPDVRIRRGPARRFVWLPLVANEVPL